MKSRCDRQIIESFFQKCIEGSAGSHPNKSIEIENIENNLKDLSNQLNSLEDRIKFSNSELVSFTIYSYLFDMLKGIFKEDSTFRKLQRFIVDKPIILLLLLMLAWFLSFFLGKLLFLLLIIISLIYLVKIGYESKYKKLKEYIDLSENRKSHLISKFRDLREIKSIKEREYRDYCDNERESMMALEQEVQRFLEEDKRNLVREAAKILRFKLPPSYAEVIESLNYSERMEQDPIVICTGNASPFTKRQRGFFKGTNAIGSEEILEFDSVYRDVLVESKFHIPSEGLKNPFSGKSGYYQFYKIEIILLGSNFLSYYSCFWDFLKGDCVDPRTGEYFYDSITSIETQERSSLRQKSSPRRRIYSEILSISTFDGKVLRIRQKKDRLYKDSNKSEINQAAEEIRQWLRRHKEHKHNS